METEMIRPPIAIDLGGVQETLLWPLYCRSAEASRADGLLVDPKAIEVFQSIDYEFEQRFGVPEVVFALRAACFDRAVSAFLDEHPDGTVVALGDGLETQFWRIDNRSANWVSVDLPEAIALRRKLLPDGDRNTSVVHSALDTRWFDAIDADADVFITAQGLFMYLQQEEVIDLIRACSERFRGGSLMFDAVPSWMTKRTGNGTRLSTLMMRGRDDDTSYSLPPMPWGMNVDTIRRTIGALEKVSSTETRTQPPGRGFGLKILYPAMVTMPLVRNICPSNILVRFDD